MARHHLQNSIGAVEKSLAIVESLYELNGARVTELANHLDWAKSTVHIHLKTLENQEYVFKSGDRYELSFKFLQFGEYVKVKNDYYADIEPKVVELANETKERVQFVVCEHDKAVYLQIAEGARAASTGGQIGKRRPVLHATAAGKAILASLPNADVRAIVENVGLQRFTANTITDEEALFEELNRIRAENVAFNNQEHIDGLRAVGTAITEEDGTVLGGLSIAGPASRFQGDRFTDALPELLLGVANEVELNIVYS